MLLKLPPTNALELELIVPFRVNAPGSVTAVPVSTLTDFPAGYVRNTFLTSAESVIGDVLPLELDRMVVRARLGPVVEYVPIPTSHAPPSTMV